MTSPLFGIASEKGPQTAVSPETDRAVKPVLRCQQGIITFPHGAAPPQQLSHTQGGDWNLIAVTHSSWIAVHTWALGLTPTRAVHTADMAEEQTQRHTHTEDHMHLLTHSNVLLLICSHQLYALLSVETGVWEASSKRRTLPLSLEPRGDAALRFTHRFPDAASTQDQLTAAHTYRWTGIQKGNTWALHTVRLLLMYSKG